MSSHKQTSPTESLRLAGFLRRHRGLAFAAAALVVAALVVVTYTGYIRVSFGIFDAFGPPDRIEFHGRRYYHVSKFGDQLRQIDLDTIRESRPTGEMVGPLLNRLEVYALGGAGSGTHAGLFLKQRDGKFLVYVLSGGP